MGRVYNFSAGPSMLPLAVLEKAQQEFLDYRGTGMSVLEMSHRSSAFSEIIAQAEALLRELMNIPDTYQVLFVQGGASLQFSMVPLNLFKAGTADYIHTGSWSKKAIAEARKYGHVHVASSSENQNFTYIPDVHDLRPEADYVHITTNNTIEGTVFTKLPDTGSVPLVADMSSNILSQVYDVSKFGVIYAGAQKNIGPAGLTVVIIREDLIGHAQKECPTMLNYSTHVKHSSLYNTPATYSIYMAKLVFEWLKQQGGVEAMEEKNRKKAALLYDFLDESKLFSSPVLSDYRSIMNIPFMTPTAELDAAFLQGAKAQGLETLKGHRSVGGMRASIYNAMPIEGVEQLVSYMKTFEKNYR
ncbi:3-phosphoserine/phosphohydroxythreonine transaminase [Ectobacillus antri]|jgi:phosphoserine aminotransferase|uniref:Phosphoserine aminotransferase n=1 Tax=Ectobacillus antri TaxID=2486280 RepID=A0ABT6H549_9BACI|nr:3-phosphoserine/phosphohydroxythreonine transaminase [Ectobacillus antri]MDG4657000.1 3-phosphoserine/phosphohydroxythreonine transaminase [Ectobacillus antri]MDG5754102.1 3-phosphoserine/phosphohydroxythreonine transaminase [Ectobacillus antri]